MASSRFIEGPKLSFVGEVQRVAAALAAVQAQIAKEAVVWKAGPLVMAPLVQSSLAASQVATVTPDKSSAVQNPCCCQMALGPAGIGAIIA